MKTIALTNSDKVVLVDDADYETLNQYKWFLYGRGNHAKRTSILKPREMHRAILNPPKDMEIDHINGNGLDNRRENLRLATQQQNDCNKSKRSTKCSSKYKGVSFRKDKNCWQAYVCLNKKQRHLGFFDSEKEAALAYNKAALELHGTYARINEVQ